MRCQGCGKKLRKNESFCTSCGFYNKPEKLSLENDDLGNLDYFDDPYKKEEPEEMKTELLDEYDDNDDLINRYNQLSNNYDELVQNCKNAIFLSALFG